MAPRDTATLERRGAAGTVPSRRAKGVRNTAKWAHLPLILTTLLLLFPFYWTVVMATNTNADFYLTPPKVVPGTHLLENVSSVLTSINFFGSMANTFIVAASVTLLVLFLDSMAAFAFAKYDFPAKNLLFGLMLAFFMVPAQLSTVPQFITMINIGWVGTLQALIVPAAANAFGIFWMRQYISSAVPDEILDAAVVDGCGFFRQYVLVVLPVIRPGLAFLGIYTFVAAWNDYVWPLIVLINPDMLTLQVALSQLNATRGTDYAVVMAGALLAIVPLVVVFLVFSKQFVADSVKGAVR